MEYDYSERISHNEKRIAELKGRMYTDKCTIQSLEKENERCFDAMNKLTKVIDVDKDAKDKKILELNNSIQELETKNKELRKKNRSLKTELDYTKHKLEDKINKLTLKLVTQTNNDSDDIILAETFGEENIFEDMLKV